MTETPEQLKNILSNTEMAIRYILAHYPEARNNDKLLMLLYWELADKINIPKEFRQAFLYRATPPETIRRMRQKIQEQGDYLPRQEVLEARRRKQQAMRQALSPKQKTLV
jgi:hypothetical protein